MLLSNRGNTILWLKIIHGQAMELVVLILQILVIGLVDVFGQYVDQVAQSV
jgi:hypothetical protein